MTNSRISLSVATVLRDVTTALKDEPSFSEVDKIIIILSRPSREKDSDGYMTLFSNASTAEINCLCNVAAEESEVEPDQDSLCDCSKCRAARKGREASVVH